MIAPVGLLPLLKPPGPSSQQVVAAVRRWAGRGVRVGHAGTLDPAAAGVLPVCLGAATRLAEYLQIPAKGYRFELVLGQETDTQDGTGRLLAVRDASVVTRAALEAVLATYRGERSQRVPAYSARHHDGRRLYEYARLGVEAPAPLATVRIDRLQLLHWSPGPVARALCDLRCGGGTYVRALCAEIGAALGVGAHMGHLVRTAAGGLAAAECRTLEELEAGAAPGILSPAEALAFLPAVTADPAEARAVATGRPPGRRRAGPELPPGLVRVLDADGVLLAVARCAAGDGVLDFRLEKVLV